MKILLVGGGSGGPVSPLLAVADEIKKHHPKAEFLLVGTKHGPELQMAEKAGIPFARISAGKLRRYFSVKNLFSLFITFVGFLQALRLIKCYRPGCVFGTGSFPQVPVVWAAWFLRVPVVLHQQDVYPSLANRLCQVVSSKITVTFAPSLTDFSSSIGLFYKRKREDKVVLTGNPFRERLSHGSKEKAQKEFPLRDDLPTLLVLGGGTGADFFNNLILKSLPQLSKVVQIIHSTGRGKYKTAAGENYHPYEFISNMADAYAAADIVLSRAGLSTLTELSNLKKLSIIVPMPNSHQEYNAEYIYDKKAAAVFDQSSLTPENFLQFIRRLLVEGEIQRQLKDSMAGIMPKGANTKIAEIILKFAERA